MASGYERVLAKYDWAKKHVHNFEAAVDSFRESNPHSIRRSHDVQAGQYVYYVEAVPVVPDDLSFMLGDAIHNLRSTLDHLACALVIASGSEPNSKTAFPIFDTPEAFSEMSRGKVPGLGKMALETLDRVQPYKKGWGNWAWQLHKLDIIDKHRLLLTVSTIPVARSILPSEKTAYNNGKTIIGPTSLFFRQMVLADSAPVIETVKAGHELARFPASEEYEKVGFAFDIAIDEAEVVKGMPTFLLLRKFSSEVLNVINDFARFL